MKQRWKKRPPKEPGWYVASFFAFPNIYRWWNGEYWSMAVRETDSKKQVNERAGIKAQSQNAIIWLRKAP